MNADRVQNWSDPYLLLDLEKSAFALEAIDHSETLRRQQLCQILLEHDNQELKEQITLGELQIQALAQESQAILSDLDILHNQWEKSHSEVKVKSREIEHLKAELKCLQGASSDSSRLLTEKMVLTRELTSLKLECEHSRDQMVMQQATLAEKLMLQRQLATLQVELENEKRSAHKIAQKARLSTREDDDMAVQLSTVRDQLVTEKRESQKAELDHLRLTRELEKQVANLELRLGAFKDKLKTAKEQLKAREAELSAAKFVGDATGKRTRRSPRKRHFSLVDDDTMIGTPGNGVSNKRGPRKPSTFGEKSTFSITPFLNRATSAQPESHISPTTRPAITTDKVVDAANAGTTDGKEFGLARDSKGRILGNRHKSAHQLGQSGVSEGGAGPARLEQVIEEECEGGERGTTSEINTCDSRATLENKSRPMSQLRSLKGGLGKTIFDDCDEGPARQQVMVGLGCGRGVKALGVGALQRRGPPNVTKFGAISPLKKNFRQI